MDASRRSKKDVAYLSFIHSYFPKMFHQNLSPTNIDSQQRKASKEQDFDISATVVELPKMEDLEDANVASSNEDFSPVREASLHRLTRTPLRHSTSDAVASDLEEVMSFTGKLNRMRSPMPLRHQVRSLDQELQDSTTSFIAEDGTFREEPASSNGIERHTSAPSSATDDESEVKDGVDGDDELTEDDSQSVYSMTSAQVLEARTQTFVRMTPSPLQPRRRSHLSPIAEASQENSPVTDGSTTLIESLDLHHQSPTSSGQPGFSPYAEDSGGSRQTSNSPCERIPFGHLNASLLGSTPARPSPLQQVMTATQASLRALNLEDFELPALPALPVSPTIRPTQAFRSSADLSSPLHVPLTSTTTPQIDRIHEGQLLITINAYIAHVTGDKKTRFLSRMQSLLAAHQMPPHVAPQFAQMVLQNTGSSPENTTSGSPTPQSPPDVAPLTTLLESSDRLMSMVRSPTPSSLSEPATPGRPLASLSRNDILEKMAKNNEDLRDMIMAWKDHDQTADLPRHARSPSFSPTAGSSPLGIPRRRYSGHTRSSLARAASPAVQSPFEPSPSSHRASSRISIGGKRRFSDHTFASANRSLQTVKVETPDSASKKITGGVKAATPNIIAPTPPSVPAKSTSRIAVRADDEHERAAAYSKIATPSKIAKPSMRNTAVLRSKSLNTKIIPRQPAVKLPPLSETHAHLAKTHSGIPVFSKSSRLSGVKPEDEKAYKIAGQDDVVRRARQLLKDWNAITEHLPLNNQIPPFEPKLEHEDSFDFAARFEMWHDDFLELTAKVLNEFGQDEDSSDGRRDSGNEEEFKDRSVYKRKLDEGFRKLESELNMAREVSRSLPNLLEDIGAIGSPIDPRIGQTF